MITDFERYCRCLDFLIGVNGLTLIVHMVKAIVKGLR